MVIYKNMLYEYDFENEEVFYPESDDETELIMNEHDLRPTLTTRLVTYWRKLKRPVMKVCLHITVHLKFLTLLEPLFYFLYGSKLEESIFNTKIKTLVHTSLAPMRPYIDGNIKTMIVRWIDDYQATNHLDLEETKQFNHKLFLKSLHPFYITFALGVILICIAKKYTTISIRLIYLEHLLLMLFVGIYEYWFFITIVIKYRAVTDSQLDNFVYNELQTI